MQTCLAYRLSELFVSLKVLCKNSWKINGGSKLQVFLYCTAESSVNTFISVKLYSWLIIVAINRAGIDSTFELYHLFYYIYVCRCQLIIFFMTGYLMYYGNDQGGLRHFSIILAAYQHILAVIFIYYFIFVISISNLKHIITAYCTG